MQTAHAATDIKAGDELTVAYWGDECSGQVQQERRRKTEERFGFTCACIACTLTGPSLRTSDERQRKIRVLTGLIDAADAVSSPAGDGEREQRRARLSEQVTSLRMLLREEGMPASWAQGALLSAAASARRSGDWAAATRWAGDAAACTSVA